MTACILFCGKDTAAVAMDMNVYSTITNEIVGEMNKFYFCKERNLVIGGLGCKNFVERWIRMWETKFLKATIDDISIDVLKQYVSLYDQLGQKKTESSCLFLLGWSINNQQFEVRHLEETQTGNKPTSGCCGLWSPWVPTTPDEVSLLREEILNNKPNLLLSLVTKQRVAAPYLHIGKTIQYLLLTKELLSAEIKEGVIYENIA